MPYEIHPIRPADRLTIGAAVRVRWGDERIIVHEEAFDTAGLPGLRAVDHHETIGFLHYKVRADLCEILTLASLRQRQGIGAALIQALEGLARDQGCRKLMVTTTNDNLDALAFYEHCGFVLTGVGLGLVDNSRKLKPAIPEVGAHNIPIHDEIYLEKCLEMK
jgi:GNAT superfamily N-acetyltransferase